jgi:hypothetical protein
MAQEATEIKEKKRKKKTSSVHGCKVRRCKVLRPFLSR